MLKNKKIILIIIVIALLIKFSLFLLMVFSSPDAKFQPDSTDYIRLAQMIAARGAFALENNGVFNFELYRTPGYPFFLSVLHFILKIPLAGVSFLQLLLGVLVAFVTYKAALEIDPKIAPLSAIIVLLSPPITIHSLQILADILFLILISLFMLAFILYLKNKKVKFIVLSAVLLVLATYVRPVSFYFGWGAAFFIVYAGIRDKFWRGIFHALIFLIIVYSLLGAWQLRNYLHFHRFIFTIIQSDYGSFPIFQDYAMNKVSLGKEIAPIFNYINAAWHCFLSLMTRPGSFKYFHNYALTVIGKILGYPFVVFWWVGLLVGLTKIKRSIYYQFIFFMISYFVFVTIAVVARSSSERYSIPIIPLIAIISAAGWAKLREIYVERKRIRSLQ